MALVWIFRETLSPPGADKEQALPILRNAEIDGVKDLVVFMHSIAVDLKLGDDLLKELLVFADGKAAHIFEDKILGLQLRDHSNKVVHQMVARIVERPFSDHAEPLARSPTEDYVNVGLSNRRMRADVFPVNVGDAAADRRAIREVVFRRRGVDRVVFARRRYMESRQFESERQAARARKQVNADRSL